MHCPACTLRSGNLNHVLPPNALTSVTDVHPEDDKAAISGDIPKSFFGAAVAIVFKPWIVKHAYDHTVHRTVLWGTAMHRLGKIRAVMQQRLERKLGKAVATKASRPELN